MKEVFAGLNKHIRKIPDFPKKGIIFWDMTTLASDPGALRAVLDMFYRRYKNKKLDYVASIESRGFVFGGALAYLLGVGFLLIRKKGKLPYETIEERYEKEYGLDCVQIHKDSLKKGDRVLVLDDLLATGNTAYAACKLLERLGGEVVECAFITEFTEFGAVERLKDYSIYSLIKCKETEG